MHRERDERLAARRQRCSRPRLVIPDKLCCGEPGRVKRRPVEGKLAPEGRLANVYLLPFAPRTFIDSVYSVHVRTPHEKRKATMRAWLIATAVQASIMLPSVSWAGQDIPLEKLPPAVRATVERETKGGKIKDIETDHEGGQLIYEVEFTLDGADWELDIAADGKLLERRID